MNDQQSLLSRIGKWFKHRFGPQEDLPLMDANYDPSAITHVSSRSTFLRPWARRDAAIAGLQTGFSALAGITSNLRDQLERQTRQHDELMSYLSQLSSALQAIPDTSRVQSETLRVIHQQIAFQNAQHKQLAEMIRKMSDVSSNQHELLTGLHDRVESLYQHNDALSESMQSIGSAMQTVSQNSQASTFILEQLRDTINARDGQLQETLRRQGNRMMLAVVAAILLAAISLIVVLVSNSRPTPPLAPVAPTVTQPITPNPSPAPTTMPTTSRAAIDTTEPTAILPTTWPTTLPAVR